MNDDILDLGGSETVELTRSFWDDPERLRYVANKLKAKAARIDHRYSLEPVAHEPKFTPSLADQMVRRIDDPQIDPEEEARSLRAAEAHGQRVLREEEAQKQQLQQRQRAETQAAFRATGIGRLMSRREPW
jgi:hypothetical protein